MAKLKVHTEQMLEHMDGQDTLELVVN